MFSLLGRCQGECGSQKYTAIPASLVSWACLAISPPWSRASERRSCPCRELSWAVIATAPWLAIGGPFLTCGVLPKPSIRGQVQQHRVSVGALHKSPDRELLQVDDQVAFLVPGHCPVGGLGGPGGDRDLLGDEGPAAALGAGPRLTQRPPGRQTRGQLPGQYATALDIQRLVDRLVADPHRLIIGEVDREPATDLLRAPDPRYLVRGPGCRGCWSLGLV